ncbi:glycosyltransferase [Chloracidobacterium thermophilum]|uniref:glycosyltransferase n=1 Tax=Chloracidobacterium thermophilum TaxID=458033 RepID=UPI000738B1B3|nr:glycosyltransferase [Chloracidobacterium thermophilum]
MKPIVFCTIAAKNYFACIRTLADSLRAQHPQADVAALVVDRDELPPLAADGVALQLHGPADFLPETRFRPMAFKYDVTELCTAVKPFYLSHLFRQGYRKVVYLDPDILVLRPLDIVLDALDRSNIVLTPHLVEPLPLDDKIPTEVNILQAGAYNLGFIGLAAGAETERMLGWWSRRLEDLCFNEVSRGLFVDQKWIDLVPGLFDGVQVLRHPGLNVAYWNLRERDITQQDGQFFAKGKPILFFHFSGYDTSRPTVISRHLSRYTLEEYPVVAPLFERYTELLAAHGHARYRRIPYGFATFDNGFPIEPAMRRQYAEALRQGRPFGDPFAAGGRRSFFQEITGVQPVELPMGVNIAGYFRAELGIGEAARGYVHVIQKLGYATSLYDFSDTAPSRKLDATFGEFSRDNPFGINLICVNADQVEVFASRATEDFFRDRYNIGLWAWELPDFPSEWVPCARRFDEIWTASHFIRASLEKSLETPVYTIPHVVEPGAVTPRSKSYFGLREDAFCFLYSFDFNSTFERKNPLAAVAAFKRAFRPDEPVCLVLKCINEHLAPESFARLTAAVQGSNIRILNGYLSREDKHALTQACDAYISLHRSEGFGLTIAEAMYFGKPVIATGWSGNMDFMTPDNSFPVEVTPVAIRETTHVYRAGNIWAEPNVEHAARLMREVYEHPEAARARGEQAARDIREYHSIAAIGRVVEARLREIERCRRAKVIQRALAARQEPASAPAASPAVTTPDLPVAIQNGYQGGQGWQLALRSQPELVRQMLPLPGEAYVEDSKVGTLGRLSKRLLARLFRFYIFHQNKLNVHLQGRVAELTEDVHRLNEALAELRARLLHPDKH